MPVCWEKGVHRTLVTTTHVTNHSFLRKRNLTHGLGAKERPQSLQLKVFRDWHPEHTAARALLQGGQFLLDWADLLLPQMQGRLEHPSPLLPGPFGSE